LGGCDEEAFVTIEREHATEDTPLIRVGALHALGYCERLFYLEEVEEVRLPDAAVYAGRALHAEIEKEEGDLVECFTLASPTLGLLGKLDAIRRRDGRWIPYEHKKGRAARDDAKRPQAWKSDRLQITAYAMLLEEHTQEPVDEARIRYHQDGVTVRGAVDEHAREDVRRAVARARELRMSIERPPVATNEHLCVRCSLAPVCLPEEERLARDPTWQPVKLSVVDDERQVVHVLSYGQRVGRAGNELTVTPREGEAVKLPIHEVKHVVLHGGAQISSQAIHHCVEHDVHVSWVTGGGRWVGTLASTGTHVQRRVRQYKALSDEAACLALARRLVVAKIEGQLRFVLRATRGDKEAERRAHVASAVGAMRRCLRTASHATSSTVLLGQEGEAAAQYFSTWEVLLGEDVDARLRFVGRTRRPPKDRVSALLGFGYALLLNEVVAAIRSVGLEPALGFYHAPRSSAPPLALDLMELFRVPLVDMPVVASINRGQWDPDADFVVTGVKVWLSEAGRRKFIEVFERRKEEEWRHSVVGYSLSYGRMIELEARLLEKEWSGSPGLFAGFRLR
jgi:CRISPR-associated protein Cas1